MIKVITNNGILPVTYKINGTSHPVLEVIEFDGGARIPLLDIEWQSDEDWQKGAIQNAVDNYIKHFGKPPKNEKQAVEWQRKRVEKAVEELNQSMAQKTNRGY